MQTAMSALIRSALSTIFQSGLLSDEMKYSVVFDVFTLTPSGMIPLSFIWKTDVFDILTFCVAAPEVFSEANTAYVSAVRKFTSSHRKSEGVLTQLPLPLLWPCQMLQEVSREFQVRARTPLVNLNCNKYLVYHLRVDVDIMLLVSFVCSSS